MFPASDPAYRVSFPRLRSGIAVRAVERGDPAAPPVLFIHGWGCSAYVFNQNLPVVSDAGFRSIAVDLKGHGLSDKPVHPRDYQVESLIEHLHEILDALGLHRPALVGHSLGGALIYHFAAHYPERVHCLGLLSPVGLKGVPLMGLYRAMTPRLLTPLLRRVRSRAFVRIALRRVYGKRGHYTSQDIEEYFAPAQFPEYAVAMRQLLHSYDWSAATHRRLKTVDVPAIGLWGTLDHLMPDDGMGVFAPLLPKISLRAISDAGHVIPQETPDDVNTALLALLRSVYD
jgi:4,5:9,10-diseco-3-hydroxy-5,9,17-trioxoandrosta-1(10),2-diene-4-oate hydrolase